MTDFERWVTTECGGMTYGEWLEQEANAQQRALERVSLAAVIQVDSGVPAFWEGYQ